MSDCAGELRRIISERGPIGVAEFMRVALTDPNAGYYVRRNAISGDFITAPEISQMFGELIGLFFVQLWEDRGRPKSFHLIELGPGRGTLMGDLLRAARIRPEFLEAAKIHLVEISPAMRSLQQRSLAGHCVAWHLDFAEVPADGMQFVIANEFFDALPVRQFIRSNGQWRERKITAERSSFSFVIGEAAEDDLIPFSLRNAPEGSVFEISEAAADIATQVARRVVATRGASLMIDYGHLRSGYADTFQAVRSHAYADPLAAPGDADLTCHVDFAVLARIAIEQGARVFGPVTQREFLCALGIRDRSERLKRSAPAHAEAIDAGVTRLIGDSQMGTLFKAVGFCSPMDSLPGFPC